MYTINTYPSDHPTRRIDTWTPPEHAQLAYGEKPSRETVHVVNSADMTPVHATYPTGYDARCGGCYLGFAHSTAKHERAISDNAPVASQEAQDSPIVARVDELLSTPDDGTFWCKSTRYPTFESYMAAGRPKRQ